MIREHRKSLARLLLLLPVMAVVLVSEVYGVPAAGASVPADPQAPLGPFAPSVAAWYDGLIQYSSVTNCASIIFGNPYQEKGVGAYTGFYADPNVPQPTPNSVYYVHVVIAGLGNPCSGTRFYVDVQLPNATSLAISSSNKVRCF